MKLFVTYKKYETLEKELDEANVYIKELEKHNMMKSDLISHNRKIYLGVNKENIKLKNDLNQKELDLDIAKSNLKLSEKQLKHEKEITDCLYATLELNKIKIDSLEKQVKKSNLELIKKYNSKYKRKRIRNKKIKEAEIKAAENLIKELL